MCWKYGLRVVTAVGSIPRAGSHELLIPLLDIGGGNVKDDVKVSLAQIALHWMVEQVMQSECGILFDNDELASIGFTAPPISSQITPGSNANAASEVKSTQSDTDTNDSVVQELPNESHQPTLSPEGFPEHSDAIAPSFDQLNINKFWWLLEFIPSSYTWQDHNGVWHSKWRYAQEYYPIHVA